VHLGRRNYIRICQNAQFKIMLRKISKLCQIQTICNIPHVSNGILPVKRVRGLMFMESTYDGKCLLRDVS
jgi:hypothetical protein